MFWALAWKTPIFYGRAVRKTPNASHLHAAEREHVVHAGELRGIEHARVDAAGIRPGRGRGSHHHAALVIVFGVDGDVISMPPCYYFV